MISRDDPLKCYNPKVVSQGPTSQPAAPQSFAEAWRATRDRRSLRSGHPASGPDASQPAFVAFDPLRLPIRRSALLGPPPPKRSVKSDHILRRGLRLGVRGRC